MSSGAYYRSWMDKPHLDPNTNLLMKEYVQGIGEFMRLVQQQPDAKSGFSRNYKVWYLHGETGYEYGSTSEPQPVSELQPDIRLEESRTDIDYGVGYGGGGSHLADLSVFVELKARVGLCRALSSCSSFCMVFGEVLVVEWSIYLSWSQGLVSRPGSGLCFCSGEATVFHRRRVHRDACWSCRQAFGAASSAISSFHQRGVALKRKKTELGSLVSGQGVSWDLPLSQIIPSSMGLWCLDSPSSQPALSGGLVLPTLFAVHGVLTPPQSTLLRRCHEKSSIRGNEVSPTFLWSTSTVENGDCIFEDLRNRLADGVG
ncbi:hypothetical protein DY000_02007953 [Brassica cretica]|uniref:Uncharacterized protein n=1 Tax=Brassica cretica TaxID=69181 RepID=A0ABQ7CHY7_BRACR|nr:hypothetical protein DY000_02007953 [Brassica cretica]